MPTHEIFTHPPSGGKGIRLFLGYIVPAGIAAYAIIAGLIDADIIIPIKRAGSVEGGSARWLGVTYLSVAAFMHFQLWLGPERKTLAPQPARQMDIRVDLLGFRRHGLV